MANNRTRENGIAEQGKPLGIAGCTLHKPNTNTTRQALIWNPQETRKRRRLRNSGRRSMEWEMKEAGFSCQQLGRQFFASTFMFSPFSQNSTPSENKNAVVRPGDFGGIRFL